MPDQPHKAFEWYRALLELGRFEVQHARQRFFDITKLHLAVSGAILALDSFALTKNEASILGLAALVSLFGIVNALAWWRQIESASVWEARWYLSAAALEKSREFRREVGVDNLDVWSHPDVQQKLPPDIKKSGASPRVYKTFVVSLVIFYFALLVGSTSYAMLIMCDNGTQHDVPTNSEANR